MILTLRYYRIISIYALALRIDVDKKIQLTSRQNILYQLFKEKENITKSESALLLNVSNDTALREIKVLILKGLVAKKGTGKSTV